MQVLVVDDDPVMVLMLRDALELNGYEVLTAEDGGEALEILKKTECRLVITDWDMPGMDGVELCSAIRRLDWGIYIYRLLLTGKGGSSHVVEGLTAGADDFLSKPCNLPELMVRLRAGERVLAMSSGILYGLVTKSSAPAINPSTICTVSSLAVSRIV